jgi:hypothetical protein
MPNNKLYSGAMQNQKNVLLVKVSDNNNWREAAYFYWLSATIRYLLLIINGW